MAKKSQSLQKLLAEVRASATARLLIVGQAPGTRVHNTGLSWNDPSGDRLRAWMNVERDTVSAQAQKR